MKMKKTNNICFIDDIRDSAQRLKSGSRVRSIKGPASARAVSLGIKEPILDRFEAAALP
jgi:hypothetical protein